MKKIFTILLLTIAFCFNVSVAQEPVEINGYTIIEINGEYYDITGTDTLKVISDVLTIKYNPGTTDQQIIAIEQNYNLQKTFHAPTGWINYKLDSISDVIDIMQELAINEVIHKVLLNHFIPLFANPNEQDWVARDTGQTLLQQLCSAGVPIYNTSHLLMQVDSAWNITTGSPHVAIGFMDSGTAINHPDIGVGNDGYHNLWVNQGEILDGKDNDENGYIDDLYGWNFVDNNNKLIIDDTTKNHGTMVASNACAKTNNQLGTFGIAGGWGSKGSGIMTLKVGNDPWVYTSLTPPALFYAMQNGARIVNMSFGNYTSIHVSLAEAIELAIEKYNCLIFGAAGNNNNNPISWPARHHDVIAIGASAFYCDGGVFMERRWISSDTTYGSSFGAELDIVAPSYAYYCDNQSGYSWRELTTATSGATAFASGVAALILSANPCLLNYEVKEILTSTAEKIDTLNGNYDANGHSIYYGYGRINAYQAVLAAEQKMGYPDTTITNSTTWNTRIRYSGDITIASGATLTITSMLYMDAGTKIIVEPGGKLVVDGGTITTACLYPWRGIAVLGNPNLSQAPTSNQGWVQVINGGTISNAETAIRAGIKIKTYSGGTYVYTQTGGIVQIENAIFSNNKTAIELLPYNKTNISYIRHSTFETRATVPGSIVPDYFIKLIVNNIQDISGCTFKNYRNVLEPDSNARGSGIYVFNSNLKNKCSSLVTPCPPTEYYPNKFINLYYGIYVLSAEHNSYITVIKNEFENNYRGLYLSGVSNARVTSNDFIINIPFEENGGYGMYLDGCTGYWVEDNEFRHEGANPTGIGLVINNSGTEPNEVYRNRFIKLEQGISAQGINKDSGSNSGLQILCNDYINTGADILVPNTLEERGLGIAAHQGASSQNPQHMAGNLFHHHTAVDYNDINNEGEHIIYFVPFNPASGDDERVIPENYTDYTVTVVEIPFDNPWTYGQGCPCKLSFGGGGNEENLTEQITDSRQQEEETHDMLALLIDAGETEELAWDVLMSTSPEAMQLYDELMAKSPWLSDTVVSTAIIKEDVLLNAMIRDIMVANPHTAKSAKLMEELEQRWTPLPDYMKAQILQGKSLVSLKEKMESLLARHKLDKAIAVNALARLWHDNTEGLVWLWNNDNSLESKYNLAMLHLDQGEPVQGAAVLDNIPLQFDLSAEKQAEYQQFGALYSYLASVYQSGSNSLEPDSLQVSALFDLAAGATGKASVFARNILLALNLAEYHEPVLLPGLLKSRRLAREYRKLMESEAPKNLGVYPIPANDFVIVEYMLEKSSKAVIEFTDATGRLVYRLNVNEAVDQQIVDTRNWKPGWYIATLKEPNKTHESVKFIITD